MPCGLLTSTAGTGPPRSMTPTLRFFSPCHGCYSKIPSLLVPSEKQKKEPLISTRSGMPSIVTHRSALLLPAPGPANGAISITTIHRREWSDVRSSETNQTSADPTKKSRVCFQLLQTPPCGDGPCCRLTGSYCLARRGLHPRVSAPAGAHGKGAPRMSGRRPSGLH